MEQLEALQPDQLADALRCLLAVPGSGRLADRDRVRGFLDYLASCPIRWEGLRCRSGDSVTGLFLALLLPGSTAIVMIPSPGELDIKPDAQQRVVTAGLEHLRPLRLHYAQALLAPEAEAQRHLLGRLGFRRLAPLVYLERDATYPWVDALGVPEVIWTRFSENAHGEFAATLLATYEDSRDCPELTGLRPIDDVLAAHQASGAFDPSLWELLRVRGVSAGCLLLARLIDASALEVVYMGVVPAFRRRGIGSLLMQRAVQRCCEVRARRLTLVVDERNEPAQRLYQRFALRPVARRDAYLYRWPGAVSAPHGV